MHLIEFLIQKFWQDKATPQEAVLLENLRASEATEYREKLLSEYNNLVESGLVSSTLKPERAKAVLTELHSKINLVSWAEPRAVPMYKKAWWMAAASVIFFIAGFQLYKNIGVNNAHPSNTIIVVKNNKVPTSLRIINNESDTVLSIALADGSTVKLQPKSCLYYDGQFNQVTRDITLSGEAFFKVAKDRTRPFTVYASGYTTTALGTAFSVNTSSRSQVSIKLYQGKVVIKKVSNTDTSAAVYLLPNQQYVVNTLLSKSEVSDFTSHTINPAVAGKKTIEAKQNKELAFKFEHEPLSGVFKKLQESFHVKISCNNKDISGLYLTGEFLKQDKLPAILSVICNMNELFYAQNEGEITVTKAN